MHEIEKLQGISGMLRPFRRYIEELKLSAGAQIIFYGCTGTCLPIVELLAYSIRTLPVTCIFVPYISETDAAVLKNDEKYGMQIVHGECPKLNPAAVVIMGGLSMKTSNLTAEEVLAVTGKYDCRRIGICFMNFLEKEGWTEKFDFDLYIDAQIDPVSVNIK